MKGKSFKQKLQTVKYYAAHSSDPDKINKLVDAAENMDKYSHERQMQIQAAISKLFVSIHGHIRKLNEKPTPPVSDLHEIAKRIKKEKGTTWAEAKELAAKEIASKMKKEEKALEKAYGKDLDKALEEIGDVHQDALRTAMPPGKRISISDQIYYENRANRTDRRGGKYPSL